MALSFHAIKILSQETMDAARKSPDPGGRLRKADMHFSDGPHKHAMAHLLTQPDIETAIKRIMEDRDVVRSVARAALMSAVEHAPDAWKKDSKFLHSLGIVKIGKQFFVLPPELLKDSLFDKTRERLAPEAREILDQSLKAALTGKLSGTISLGTTTVQYVAAQLIQDVTERGFRLSALSAVRSKQVDADHMYNSTRAIRHFAAELNINLAGIGVSLREGEAMARKQQVPAPQRPATVQPLSRVHQEAGIRPAKFQEGDGVDVKGELRLALQRHIHAESITRPEAAVYFFMAGTLDSEGPTIEAAAKKFGISQEQVGIIVDEVNGVLYGSSAPEPQKLIVRR